MASVRVTTSKAQKVGRIHFDDYPVSLQNNGFWIRLQIHSYMIFFLFFPVDWIF